MSCCTRYSCGACQQQLTLSCGEHLSTLHRKHFSKNEHQLHCFANQLVNIELPCEMSPPSSNLQCPPHLPWRHCDGVSQGLHVRVELTMFSTVAPSFQPLAVFWSLYPGLRLCYAKLSWILELHTDYLLWHLSQLYASEKATNFKSSNSLQNFHHKWHF